LVQQSSLKQMQIGERQSWETTGVRGGVRVTTGAPRKWVSIRPAPKKRICCKKSS
jgi:hypothetical protein